MERRGHSLGDRATRVVVQNHAAAMDENATWDSRHTLTHLQFVDARDIPRFGELGLVASMSQQWNQRDGWSVDGIEGYIAPERQDNMYPTKDLIDGGAIVAQGSDWPVTDLLPWAAIEQAVTREGQVNPARAIYPGAQNIGDAITYEQALKTSTIGVAYQMHRDDVSGSIEVGKVADLIVLDSDPYDPSGGELAGANDAEAAAERTLAAAEDELARVQPSLKPAKASLKKATKRAKKAKAKDKKAKAKLERAKARGNAKQVKRAKAKRQRTRKRAKAAAKKAKSERRKLRNRRAAVAAAREAVATGKQELAATRAARALAEGNVADRQADYESAFEEAVKQVSETKVLRTMVAGKTVYQAEG